MLKPCLGFRFTRLDEIRMTNARLDARRYMKTFGQGYTPQPIDKSRYVCSESKRNPILKANENR